MKSHYALKVGKDGASRLKLLNDMCNPATIEFIQKNIVLKNKKVLDLGCGTGILACELAKRCEPGELVAADISQEQLDITETNAKNAGLKNISFKKISAYEIDKIEMKFDLIYCRFVLAHLQSVNEVIAKIVSILNIQGVLICEEPNSVDSLYCVPEESVFEKWKKAVWQQVAVSKANFAIGKSLHSLFAKNNLTVMQSRTTQAMLTTSDLKQQLWMGMVEISSLLQTSQFATENEIEEMIVGLKEFANTSNAEVGYLQCTQIAARRG